GLRLMRSNTSSASRRCGMTFGWAKFETSITGRPRSERRSIMAILVSVSIQRGKLCRPSLGPTSATTISLGKYSAIGLPSQTFEAGIVGQRRALGDEAIDL